MLQIGDNLQIDPSQFAEEGKRTAALGMTGSGKTNTLMVQAEEFMAHGWPISGIDPNGQLWRLKEQGFPVIVASNRANADMPLTVESAPILATFSFQQRVSIILDTRMLEPGVDMEVITAYLETLWRLILTQEDETKAEPYGLVIDEAQLFLPQFGIKPTTPIINDMGKRGRYFKLSIMVATQRPASIQKDFLDQADLVFWQKLRGKALEAAAEGMSMSVREVRQLMKPFTKGTALLGDADAFIGDVDYLVVQVRPRRGLKASEPAQSVVTTGLRPIDSTLLGELRKLMKDEEAAKPKPKPEAAVQLDMTLALENAVATQKVEIQQMRARYASLMMAVYWERTALKKQLAMADDRVKALQARPVIVDPVEPTPVPIPALAIAGEEMVEYSVTTRTETYRSSRSIAMAVNRQRGAFKTFMDRVQALRPIHRRVLALAVDKERGQLSIDKLTTKLDYSYDALRHALADLFKMGLILRLDARTYQSNVHSYFRQKYEDLSQDELIEQLWGILAE